ncbi:MAG: hypothetical protein LPK47_02160 [Bacteroidota bacterium]|nr:hypothetical protein [Bacteroidota bacterium]
MKDEKDFDKWLRSKINDLESGSEGPSDWSSMEKKLVTHERARFIRMVWPLAMLILVMFRPEVPTAFTPRKPLLQNYQEWFSSNPEPLYVMRKREETPEETLKEDLRPDEIQYALLIQPRHINFPTPRRSIAMNQPYRVDGEVVTNEVGAALRLFPKGMANIYPVDRESEKEKSPEAKPDVIRPLWDEDTRWVISLNVYPSYSFREFMVDGTKSQKVHKDYAGLLESSEKGGVAFNAGVDVQYRIGKDLYLGSGLQFIQTKINAAYDYTLNEVPKFDPKNGDIIGYTPLPDPVHFDRDNQNAYHYLHVPLTLSYKPWATKRLQLTLEGGAGLLFFTGATGTTLNYQTLTPVDISFYEYNKQLTTINARIGASYFLTRSISVGLHPTLLYFTESIYKKDDMPVYMTPFSMGLNFNVQVRLN